MEIKDSGQRSQFSTGAQRDCQAGKGRMDLLPFRALIELAKVYEEGAKKYNDNNWRKGIPLSRYVDSGMRHLAKWMIGWRDEPHLAQAAWNIMCLIETSKMIEEGLLPAELNDLPYHVIEMLNNPNNIPPLVTADNRAAPPVDVEAMEKSLADIEAGRVQPIEKVIEKFGLPPDTMMELAASYRESVSRPYQGRFPEFIYPSLGVPYDDSLGLGHPVKTHHDVPVCDPPFVQRECTGEFDCACKYPKVSDV